MKDERKHNNILYFIRNRWMDVCCVSVWQWQTEKAAEKHKNVDKCFYKSTLETSFSCHHTPVSNKYPNV